MKAPVNSAAYEIKSQPGSIVSSYNGLGGRITAAAGKVHFPQPHVSFIPVDMFGTTIQMPKVEWYKTGGVFDNPSIIGVGEAGREVEPMLREIVREESGADMGEVLSLLRALLDKDTNIYIDKRELVGATVGATDRALGTRQAYSRRGLANYA